MFNVLQITKQMRQTFSLVFRGNTASQREMVEQMRAINRVHGRLAVVALVGAAIGYITYELIYFLVRWEPRSTISWTLAFIIGVVRQHYLHRRWTFQLFRRPLGSLVRAFILYSGSATTGAAVNYTLVDLMGVNHRIAWFVCLLITATFSLVFLKSFVFKIHSYSEVP